MKPSLEREEISGARNPALKEITSRILSSHLKLNQGLASYPTRSKTRAVVQWTLLRASRDLTGSRNAKGQAIPQFKSHLGETSSFFLSLFS